LKDQRYEIRFNQNRISELKSIKLALEEEIESLRQRRDDYDDINPI
jgi:prefoldin subunit 5